MKNVLLLGGTGAMGKYIASEFGRDENATCYVTTRQHNRQNSTSVKFVNGNAHLMDFLKSVLSLKNGMLL